MKVKRFVVQNEAGEQSGGAGGSIKTITPEEFEAVNAELARFKAKHAESEKHLKNQEKAAKDAAEEVARKNGDVAALEKSWQEKLNSEVAAREARLAEYQGTINNMTVGTTARSMAAELALQGSAEVLLPHIERRLKVEIVDGATSIRVLDATGKPSAMSVDELKAEILANKAFAPLLVGSKASGSGDVGKKANIGAKSVSRGAFDSMNPAEKMAHIKGGGVIAD